MSISGTFTAPGTSSIYPTPGDVFCRITITGTFVGTIQIQQSAGAAAWRLMLIVTAPGEFTFPGSKSYRVQCTEFTSGMIEYAIESVRTSSGASGGAFNGSASDVTFDPADSGSPESDVQEALDDLYERVAGIPTLIRRTYLIRGGYNGVEDGTVDDTQGAINLAQMQETCDLADENTAAIEVDTQTFQIAGGPLIIRSSSNGVVWDASTFSRFEQRSNNVGILQLGDASTTCQNLRFEGANVHYVNDQNGNTNANAVTIYNQWKSSIGRIQVSNTITNARSYRGIYFPQGEAVFSCHFYDWFVFQSRYSLLHIANFGTGNAYENIYLSGVGSGGSAGVVEFPFLWQMGSGSQMHDSSFDQLNIEWCISNVLARFNNVRGPVFNSFHIEQCILSGANAQMIRNIISNIQIDSLLLLDVRVQAANATDFPAVHSGFNNGRTNIDTFTWINNSSSYVDRSYYLHYQTAADGFANNPSYLSVKSMRLVDGSGTVLRDNMIMDRTLGGTDKDGATWPTFDMDSANEIHLGGAMSRVKGGNFRPTASKRLYGQYLMDAPTVIVPSSSTITLTLDNFMGPSGSRWENVPIPDGAVVTFHRAGTTTGQVLIANHAGSTILTLPDAAASAEYSAYRSGGAWVAA